MPKTIYHGRIGYCIYCGSTGPDLSREHIVPLSLGGNHVLEKASCQACSTITGQFEQFCARTILGPFRVREDLPTRHPDQRPDKLALVLVDENGSLREIQVPPEEHPATIMMPILTAPHILDPGAERRETFRIWFALPDPSFLDLPTRLGAKAMRLGQFEILSFCRLVAKIAHAGAYMDPNWTSHFEPLLPDFIRGETDDYKSLVGGIDSATNEPDEMEFPIQFKSVDVGDLRYCVAEVRLFATQGSPIYRIVVGRRNIVQRL